MKRQQSLPSPEQTILSFFSDAGEWEDDIFAAQQRLIDEAVKRRTDYSDELRKFWQQVQKEFIARIGKYCTPNCIPKTISSVTKPSRYGKRGEKIVDVVVTSKSCEVHTKGSHIFGGSTERHIYLLVRSKDVWAIDQKKEVRADGRQFKVSLF